MRVIESPRELQAVRRRLLGYVGAVYTMGALHAGHLSLVKQAREENDAVIVSIFLNPIQFNNSDDLARYPRTLEHDLELLEAAEVDIAFTPTSEAMYPPHFQTMVQVENVSEGLEGTARPHHFRGVATVVAKLFNLTQPVYAYFGQKDAQQVVVIRRMVRDLDFPVNVIVCPTVREADGLALSSRNVHLSDAERAAAPALYRALQQTAQVYETGEREPAALRAAAHEVLAKEPLLSIDYIALNDPTNLHGVHTAVETPLLLSIAAFAGKTRLIDNCLLPWSLNTQEDLTALLGSV
ncbi:MAG: pantoate--beta-alanine ligase [Aggregatilineales bacterium]